MKWILRLALAATVVFAARAQNYQGNFDAANCSALWGWAWDANNPNAPMWVDLYDGTTLIDRVNANIYRPDLYALHMGTGNYG